MNGADQLLKKLVLSAPIFLLLALSWAPARADESIAGRQWADRMHIKNPYRCAGPTDSFVRGCQARARQLAKNQTILHTNFHTSGGGRPSPHAHVPIHSPLRNTPTTRR